MPNNENSGEFTDDFFRPDYSQNETQKSPLQPGRRPFVGTWGTTRHGVVDKNMDKEM